MRPRIVKRAPFWVMHGDSVSIDPRDVRFRTVRHAILRPHV